MGVTWASLGRIQGAGRTWKRAAESARQAPRGPGGARPARAAGRRVRQCVGGVAQERERGRRWRRGRRRPVTIRPRRQTSPRRPESRPTRCPVASRETREFPRVRSPSVYGQAAGENRAPPPSAPVASRQVRPGGIVSDHKVPPGGVVRFGTGGRITRRNLYQGVALRVRGWRFAPARDSARSGGHRFGGGYSRPRNERRRVTTAGRRGAAQYLGGQVVGGFGAVRRWRRARATSGAVASARPRNSMAASTFPARAQENSFSRRAASARNSSMVRIARSPFVSGTQSPAACRG